MSYPVLVLFGTGLATEELRPPLVEVDKLLRILATLELVLFVSQLSEHVQLNKPLTVVSRDRSAQPRKTCVNFQAGEDLDHQYHPQKL